MDSITSTIGPVALGWVADRTSHQAVAFLCSTFVDGLGIILLALARPPAHGSQAIEA